MEEFLTFNTT